ncbi:sensor histidine kinase [Bacillus sp. F19]|nr:sensor histidine kinase [Bacillus sp. F19]
MEFVEKRKWLWIEWLFFITYTCSYGLVSIYPFIILENETVPYFQFFIWTAISYALPLLFWRSGYINRKWFPFIVFLTYGLLEIYLSYTMHMFANILSFSLIIVGFLSHRWTWWYIILIFVIGVPITEFFFVDLTYVYIHLAFQILNASFALGMGYCIQRLSETSIQMKQLYEKNLCQYRKIKEQNRALELYSEQIEKVTILEERNRMAKELHDTVGHTFTSVIMGMDAVIYLLEKDPERAKEKLITLSNVTRKGLDEVRRSIHQISPYDEGHSLHHELSQRAREFAVHTQTNVQFQLNGEETAVSKPIRLVLVRCLQEALTNAKRHGNAETIEVTLSFTADGIELLVKDDGIGADQISPGFGLNSMKERLLAIQGTMAISSSKGKGTTVTWTVPKGVSVNEKNPITAR